MKFVDCLIKLVGLPGDEAKKNVFPLSLKGKALAWYRLCDDIGSWNWNKLKLELTFHQKNYPMHLVHHDQNYIYNFWPREGESITQAWGGLIQCYIHAPIMSSQEKLLFKIFITFGLRLIWIFCETKKHATNRNWHWINRFVQ